MSVKVKSTLLKAKSLAKRGDLQAAARLYMAILEQFPANKQASDGLAALAARGATIARAGAQPSERELKELITLFNSGCLDQVLAQGELLTTEYPGDPLIHNLLGAANARLGNNENAIASFRTAIKLKPDYADAYANLGAVFNTLGRNLEAIECYTRAIQAEPEAADTHFNLGNALGDAGRLDEAISCYETAIRLQPAFAQAYNNMGNAFRKLGRLDQAQRCLRAALQKKPDYAEAYNNLGNLLEEMGAVEEAVSCLGRAVQINPAYAHAYSNMANVLRRLGRFDEAVASCRRAIELRPAFAEAHNVMGSIYFERGDYPKAVSCYAAALKLRPEFATAMAQMLHSQAHICDWTAIKVNADLIPELGITGDAVEPFSMLAFEDAPGHHCQRSRLYAKNFVSAPEGEELPCRETWPERLRIGYFSADFHSHATLYLMIGMFEQHNRERFAVHAFSYGPHSDDDMRARLKGAVEVFHDVRSLSDRDIVELARSLDIDIAIDLKGYTQFARPGIFALRAAPVQISYLGYPGTTGLPAMDYLIADPLVIPAEQCEHYTEKIIYLPHCYQVNDRSREISELGVTREKEGLPGDAFVFCCFNNNYKISPAEFDVWMRLLQQVDGSVLWLLQTNEWAARALLSHAGERGIDQGRIVFAVRKPHAEHLARHRLADLFLDCFNYNAHTTASDALWAGLPMVTRLGDGFAARVGGSLLAAVGLAELITHSVQEYEQLALELALDAERLAGVRQKLASNRLTTPLFDTGQFTRHIERAYEEVCRACFESREVGTIRVVDEVLTG